MFVDDEEMGTIRLARRVYSIESPPEDGLCVGGLADELPLAEMAATDQPFRGLLKDLAFDRQLLDLNHKHFFRPSPIAA